MVRFLTVLAAIAGFASVRSLSTHQQNGSSSVDITALNKNVTATGGTGAVSAAGTLPPFGGIGVGCGINWQEGGTYGGGLQSGSESFGLGGGFTISKDKMSIGLGIGVVPVNFNSSVTYEASTNGTVSLFFASSNTVTCEQAVVNGLTGVKCTTLSS